MEVGAAPVILLIFGLKQKPRLIGGVFRGRLFLVPKALAEFSVKVAEILIDALMMELNPVLHIGKPRVDAGFGGVKPFFQPLERT